MDVFIKSVRLIYCKIEIGAQPDVARRTDDQDFKVDRVRHPAVLRRIIIRKRAARERNRNGLFSPGSKKIFQLFSGPRQSRVFLVNEKAAPLPRWSRISPKGSANYSHARGF
jgi:hypothetical protein